MNQQCDRCIARAKVQTTHSGNPMYWCAHHYQQFEPWLAQAVTRDEREEAARLTTK